MTRVVGLALCLALTGCATYQPLPLVRDVHLPDRVADLKVDAASMSLPALRKHAFDPSHGMDMTDIAMLAVANNPVLRVARDQRGIAHAEAFAAGLLPDPVLDFSRGYPIAGPSDSTAYSVGLSYHLTTLLSHALDVRSARETARQVDLNLLWREWQVIAASRQLFVRCIYHAKRSAVLDDEVRERERFHRQLVQEQLRGDASLADVGLDQAALQATLSRRGDMARKVLASRQALNALLGLSAETKLTLLEPKMTSGPGSAEIRQTMSTLAQRRPDLLALQAGYESEDVRYRRAIRRQFPSIDIGFSQSQDTDAISSRSFQVSVTLPIFNRNRGAVAAERATRQALHDTYTLRLVEAKSDIERLWNERSILQQLLAQQATSADVQKNVLEKLRTLQAQGDQSEAQRLVLRLRWDQQRLDEINTEQLLWEQQIALQVLLADVDTN